MQERLSAGEPAPDFPIDSPWHGSTTFYEAAAGAPAVVVFGRYLGCPICQLNIDDMKQGIEALTSKGARVFYVLQSSKDTVTSLSEESDWPFEIVLDPQAMVFADYGVRYGNPFKLIGPGIGETVRRMNAKGFKHGKFEGHETQLPAVFIVGADRTIQFAHYAKNLADMPLPEDLAESMS